MDSLQSPAEGLDPRPERRRRGSAGRSGRTASAAVRPSDCGSPRSATVDNGFPHWVGGRDRFAAVFALDNAPEPMRRPQPIAPAVPPTAGLRPSDDGSVAGSAAAGLPLLRGAAPVKEAASETPPAGQSVRPASPGNVPPASTHAAGRAGDASSSADAREPAPETPPHPQAFNPIPGQPSAPPSREAANATPAPSALTTEALPAVGSVKAPAEPEPKAAEGALIPTPASSAPLPPIRPASLGKPTKHEKTAKPHKEAKAAAEPAAPPPADAPETPAAQPAGNPLLRLFAAPSSDEPRLSAPAAR